MYYVDQTPYHRVTMPEARGAGGADERTSFVFFAYPEYSTRLSAAGKEQDKKETGWISKESRNDEQMMEQSFSLHASGKVRRTLY